jgi:tetratricopeptide (TPR) repeat protein
MNFTKHQKLIISGIIVIVLVGIYIARDRRSKNQETALNTPVNTSTTTSGTVIKTQGTGGYKIEQVPIPEGSSLPQPIPDLNRPVTKSSEAVVAPEASSYAAGKILTLQAKLKKDPSDVLAWIDLGKYQKDAGDWEGTVLSWKYASRLSPTDYVSLGNLGNLYAYFIKDKNQAEIYYKQSIAKGPLQVYLYIQLAEVYRDIFKDIGKAKAIVDQGLAKIPNNPDLLQLKASLNS